MRKMFLGKRFFVFALALSLLVLQAPTFTVSAAFAPLDCDFENASMLNGVLYEGEAGTAVSIDEPTTEVTADPLDPTNKVLKIPGNDKSNVWYWNETAISADEPFVISAKVLYTGTPVDYYMNVGGTVYPVVGGSNLYGVNWAPYYGARGDLASYAGTQWGDLKISIRLKEEGSNVASVTSEFFGGCLRYDWAMGQNRYSYWGLHFGTTNGTVYLDDFKVYKGEEALDEPADTATEIGVIAEDKCTEYQVGLGTRDGGTGWYSAWTSSAKVEDITNLGKGIEFGRSANKRVYNKAINLRTPGKYRLNYTAYDNTNGNNDIDDRVSWGSPKLSAGIVNGTGTRGVRYFELKIGEDTYVDTSKLLWDIYTVCMEVEIINGSGAATVRAKAWSINEQYPTDWTFEKNVNLASVLGVSDLYYTSFEGYDMFVNGIRIAKVPTEGLMFHQSAVSFENKDGAAITCIDDITDSLKVTASYNYFEYMPTVTFVPILAIYQDGRLIGTELGDSAQLNSCNDADVTFGFDTLPAALDLTKPYTVKFMTWDFNDGIYPYFETVELPQTPPVTLSGCKWIPDAQ